MAHKTQVVRTALEVNSVQATSMRSAFSSAVGGLEIAALAGVIIGAAEQGVAVVSDGFISGAATLAALALCPVSREYVLPSHLSVEPGHRVLLDFMGLTPVFDLDMRLGEGTGAALAMGVIDASLRDDVGYGDVRRGRRRRGGGVAPHGTPASHPRRRPGAVASQRRSSARSVARGWPHSSRGWFPAIGGLIGLAGYTVVKFAETLGVVHRAPYVVGATVIVLWALLTRMLHWDGLADVADGYWGSSDPERRLEIMSDSHTGAFGATAVALVAVLEIAALGTFLEYHQYPVFAVPVFARLAATAAAWLGKPARPGGLGSLCHRSPVSTRGGGLWR